MKVVMYVDDDAITSLSFTNQLQTVLGKDFLVINTYSGSEALKQLKYINYHRFTIHAVISDWKMRGIDGSSLLQVIRVLYPKAITILVTAYDNKCSSDIDICFDKPVNISKIRDVLLGKDK